MSPFARQRRQAVRSLWYGLLFVVVVSIPASAQPPEELAAVYRDGKAVGVASQANLLNAEARRRFLRAVSAFTLDIKVAQGLATAPAEKEILAAYSLAERKFTLAATKFELWATLDERMRLSDELMDAVPATRGGVEGKTEILETLQSDGQRAMAEARLALTTATAALREGKEKLAKAERAYLKGVPDEASRVDTRAGRCRPGRGLDGGRGEGG